MFEANNPEINVDELMQKIREEVNMRQSHSSPVDASLNVQHSEIDFSFSQIDGWLKNAESRAEVRTKWPDNLKRFPLNLVQGLQTSALKILNFIFKDQREVNLNLINSLKESVTLNKQLTAQITTLQAQVDKRWNTLGNRLQGMEWRWDTLDSRLQRIEQHCNAVDNHLQSLDQCRDAADSCLQGMEPRWDAVDDRLRSMDQCQNGVDRRLQAIEQRWDAVDSRFQSIDQHHLKNDSYLKNDLMQQKRLIALFLEEARRLSESLNQEQLQTFIKEEEHSLDAFYVAFEDQFRGSYEDIYNRLKVYLPLIEEAKTNIPSLPILDVGCGRGEWLQLLQKSGYSARGIDLNRVMIGQCQEKGLEVIEADVIDYLQSLPDASLAAVTGFHIIEHLPFEVLVKLIDETVRVLASGGLAIFESPNPENLIVGACNFYSDPTHRQPLFPPTIKFLFEQRGFFDVNLLRLSEHRLEDTLEFVEADNPLASKVNPLIQIVKSNFYAAPDFAIISKKA